MRMNNMIGRSRVGSQNTEYESLHLVIPYEDLCRDGDYRVQRLGLVPTLSKRKIKFDRPVSTVEDGMVTPQVRCTVPMQSLEVKSAARVPPFQDDR